MALDNNYKITAITGQNGNSITVQYSVTGNDGTWHDTFSDGDYYMHTSTDGGKTWSKAMKIVGEDGADVGSQILRATNEMVTLTSSRKWENRLWGSGSSGTGTKVCSEATDCPNPAIKYKWTITNTSDVTSSASYITQDSVPLLLGTEYTLSCYARKKSSSAAIKMNLQWYKDANHKGAQSYDLTDKWTLYKFTFTPIINSPNIYAGAVNGVTGDAIEICGLKLELGKKPSIWSEYQDDLMAYSYEIDCPMTYKAKSTVEFKFYKVQSGSRVSVSVFHVAEYSTDGTTWGKFSGSSITGSSFITSIINTYVKVKCSIYASKSAYDAGEAPLDVEYSSLISDGTNSTSVYLGNENITLACDKDGKLKVAYSSTIKVGAYTGTTRKASTITKGTCTSNLTVGTITNGTSSADGSIAISMPINTVATAGTLIFSIVANGITFSKTVNVSVVKDGQTGAKGETGVGVWSPICSNEITELGSKFYKSSGSSDWGNGQVYSRDCFERCYVSFTVGSTSRVMVGLATDPLKEGLEAHFNAIDYAFYIQGSSYNIYESSSKKTTNSVTFTEGSVFKIEYDGENVKYYCNGEVVRTVARTSTAMLYLDSAFCTKSDSNYIDNVTFGSVGIRGSDGTSLVNKGNWATATAYKLSEYVHYTTNGISYSCKKDYPTTTFSSTTVYTTDSYVKYSSNGKYYHCKKKYSGISAWATGKSYTTSSYVRYTDNKYYKCKKAHTSSDSILPTDTTYWSSLIPTDTTYWEELVPTNTTYWSILASKGDKGDTAKSVAFRINRSAYSTETKGQVYVHGYNTNGEESDTAGYVEVNGDKYYVQGAVNSGTAKNGYIAVPITSTESTSTARIPLYVFHNGSKWQSIANEQKTPAATDIAAANYIAIATIESISGTDTPSVNAITPCLLSTVEYKMKLSYEGVVGTVADYTSAEITVYKILQNTTDKSLFYINKTYSLTKKAKRGSVVFSLGKLSIGSLSTYVPATNNPKLLMYDGTGWIELVETNPYYKEAVSVMGVDLPSIAAYYYTCINSGKLDYLTIPSVCGSYIESLTSNRAFIDELFASQIYVKNIIQSSNWNGKYSNGEVTPGTTGFALTKDGQADFNEISINKMRLKYDENNNLSLGYSVLGNISEGAFNIGIGHEALKSMTKGNQNVAIGHRCMLGKSGSRNVAIGNEAMGYQGLTVSCSSCVAIGPLALYYNTGDANIAIGPEALQGNTTGKFNIAIGTQAGLFNASGSYNVLINSKGKHDIDAYGNEIGNKWDNLIFINDKICYIEFSKEATESKVFSILTQYAVGNVSNPKYCHVGCLGHMGAVGANQNRVISVMQWPSNDKIELINQNNTLYKTITKTSSATMGESLVLWFAQVKPNAEAGGVEVSSNNY